jgi:hypothetical protein
MGGGCGAIFLREGHRPGGGPRGVGGKAAGREEGEVKIYVASSWRNQYQPNVVKALLQAGHAVYDFRNPRPGDIGFHWSEIDPNWKEWRPELFKSVLSHPIAVSGFDSDFSAMLWSDACVLVLPCGRSAHLEAGYFVGAGKPLHILLADGEPELMYRMAFVNGGIHTNLLELIEAL